jgi:hypothetical protein
MIKQLLVTILFSLILVGCGSTPRYDKLEIKDTQVIVQRVPEELTAPCVPKKPPTKEDFLKLKPHEREASLTEYSSGLLGVIKDCNVQLKKIRELPLPTETK